MNVKQWYLSKTLWLNILAVVAFAVQTFQGQPWFDPTIQASILGVCNLGARFLTSQGIGIPDTKAVSALMCACALSLSLSACNTAWMSGMGVKFDATNGSVELVYDSPEYKDQVSGVAKWYNFFDTIATSSEVESLLPGVTKWAKALDAVAGIATGTVSGK